MVLYQASDLITRVTGSRKGLFIFVLLLSNACNLQTAQSQTSVLNDTFYSSKFHFSGNLVTELRPTLNENIFFFSVASHIPYLFHLVSLLVSTGPPTIRASIHGLVINIIQSLCTCTCIKFSGESSWIRYRKIPKISPSMYKPLQIQAPQAGNAKNPPLNRPSKYKPPGGLYLENCPQIQSKTKQKR